MAVNLNLRTKVLSGRQLAQEEEELLKKHWQKLPLLKKDRQLAVVLVGNDPASLLYVRLKERAARRVGINFRFFSFPASVSFSFLQKKMVTLSQEEKVGGLMVQLPLPKSLQDKQREILAAIDPQKDVDCLTEKNLGRLFVGFPLVMPAAVAAVWRALQAGGINEENIRGREVCVVGDSNLVGKPLAAFLLNLGATVTVCHQQSRNLKEKTRRAEILISATGQRDLIKGTMVKRGAWVVDVGSPDGDVCFEEVKKKAAFITPVPGGIGPLTVVSLLRNFYLLLKGSF